MNQPITPGRYRHYKGNEYRVLGVAKHSESLEELVVYRPDYGERVLWVRPKAMFFETVKVDGQEVPRFCHLEGEPPSVDVTVYYLEMHRHCHRDITPPRDGLTVIHAKKPNVAYYHFLYNCVGGPYHWLSRAKLSDAELALLLDNPLNEVHVLHVDGVPAGFAELDRRTEGEVELVQFGLMPEFIGQGLGRYFLQWAIDQAWSYQPKRFWLHTCTLDHPAALPNYLKAGFSRCREENITRKVPATSVYTSKMM